ncbi:MAG: very short patch repair endonuclease [Ktedonobacteraceae bacterium]
MDKVSPEVRSRIMRSVRSTQNKSTEEKFKAALIETSIIGWEVRPDMQYKPDFIFPKQRIAIFIDGCFWHGCPTCANKKPASNSEYWTAKVSRNQKRDRTAYEKLSSEGWLVLRFWEHEIKNNLTTIMATVAKELKSKMEKHNNTQAISRRTRNKEQTAKNRASIIYPFDLLEKLNVLARNHNCPFNDEVIYALQKYVKQIPEKNLKVEQTKKEHQIFSMTKTGKRTSIYYPIGLLETLQNLAKEHGVPLRHEVIYALWIYVS